MATEDLTILRDALRTVLIRDLESLDREISLYPDDDSLWQTPPGILNSGGSLALHLVGNIRHFFGAVLAGNGYVRDRDAEFARRRVTREELSSEVRAAITELEKAFDKITASQLGTVYPLPIRDFRVRTADFLVHLTAHFGYHLGQLDYHRRLLTPHPASANTMDIPPLSIDSH